jgi:hypothetical protein
MAKFHIATPAGYEVEVGASSQQEAISIAKEKWQTLPRVIAKTGDKGRVLERDGKRFFVSPGFSTSDPDRVAQILQGADAGEMSRKSFDEQAIAAAPLAARATKFVEGVPFAGTFIDEALGSVLGEDATAGIRAQSAAMERQRPGQSLALNLGGAATATAATAGLLPAAALPAAMQRLRTIPGLLGGAGIGASTAALEGAVAGAGRGTDAEDRLQKAGEGAVFGAAAGGALGAAAPLLAKGADNVISLFRRSDVRSIARDLGISQDAAKVIKQTFDAGGDIQTARENLARAGQQAMLADAGPAAQALLDASIASGGTGAQAARGVIDQRATATAASLDNVLDLSLGKPPVGPQTALADIASRTAPERAAAFDKAFAVPINYEAAGGKGVIDALKRVPPRVLNDAIQEANEEMIANGQTANVIAASLNPKTGAVDFTGLPNVQQLHQIKVALGGLAEDAKGDLGKVTQKSRRFSKLASNLRSAIGEAVPEYNAAVKLGGDKIAEQQAFELGSSLLRRTTEIEDVLMTLGDSPSVSQVEAAKSGLRGSLAKALGDVRALASDPNIEARQLNEAFKALNSPNSRAKVKQLLGAEADAIFGQLDEAQQSLLVRSATARGSQTAVRQAQQGAVEQITAPGVAGELMRGEPVNTTKRLVQAITGQTDEFTQEQRQKVFGDIARALTQKRGDAARDALRNLGKAMAGQSLTDAQTNALARELVDVGFVAGATTGTRALQAEEERLTQ